MLNGKTFGRIRVSAGLWIVDTERAYEGHFGALLPPAASNDCGGVFQFDTVWKGLEGGEIDRGNPRFAFEAVVAPGLLD